MKSLFLKYREAVFWWSLVYFAVGFCIGSIETLNERNPYKGPSKSGCVYKSAIAFINPGHVVACELFRRRWDVEGFGPSLSEPAERD